MKREILESLIQERMKPTIPTGFDINEICFKEQLAFVQDTSPWVVASCSRRAGKSIGCGIDLVTTCLNNANINCLYITLTFGTAKRLVWKELVNLNNKYGLGAKANVTELTLTFPNGSTIYLAGCSSTAEVEKFRGMAFKLVYIDEVQSFKSFIKELIDDVLAPALMDYAGSLKLIGTPAPLRRGFFWEALNNKGNSVHSWTFWNNPHIALKSKKTHQQMLDRELKRRGVTTNDPSIRREWFGEWIDDTNTLVCHYNAMVNDYTKLPPILTDFVIGVDIGFNDADAIAVIGWNKHEKVCYLVEEVVTAQQGITELASQIQAVYNKYKPLKIVIDQGGLGKKVAEELRKRFQLPVQGAEKSRKLEYVAILNDALRTRAFFAKSTSRFAADSRIIEYDWDKCTPEKMVIKTDPHSDIFDAVLYSYREAIHWLSEPAKTPENSRLNWAQIAEAELYAKMQMDEDKKEWEEKQLDAENMFNMYDPFISDEENAAMYYVRKKKGEI